MPARSEKQRKLMAIALAIKRGKVSPSYSPEANKIAKSMTEQQIRDYVKEKVVPTKKRKR